MEDSQEKRQRFTLAALGDLVHLLFPATAMVVPRRVRRAGATADAPVLSQAPAGIHLLVGESGLGKPTVLRELALFALRAGRQVLALPNADVYNDTLRELAPQGNLALSLVVIDALRVSDLPHLRLLAQRHPGQPIIVACEPALAGQALRETAASEWRLLPLTIDECDLVWRTLPAAHIELRDWARQTAQHEALIGVPLFLQLASYLGDEGLLPRMSRVVLRYLEHGLTRFGAARDDLQQILVQLAQGLVARDEEQFSEQSVDGPAGQHELRWTLGGSFQRPPDGMSSESYTAVRADVGVRLAFDPQCLETTPEQKMTEEQGEDVALCIWEHELGHWRKVCPELREAELREVLVQTLPGGWHTRAPLDPSYWNDLFARIGKAIEELAARPPRRLHVFYNGPYSLSAGLGFLLRERLMGRAVPVTVYQGDPSRARWEAWWSDVPALVSASSLMELDPGSGDATTRDVVLGIGITNAIDPRAATLAGTCQGPTAYARLKSPAQTLSPTQGPQAAADVVFAVSQLCDRYPQARVHLLYSGPWAVMAQAATYLYKKPVTVYEAIAMDVGRQYVAALDLLSREVVLGPRSGPISVAEGDWPEKLRFLILADEWASRKGGISTFNRDLCIALANAKHRVYAHIPPCNLEGQDREQAKAAGVELVSSGENGLEQQQEFMARPSLPHGPPHVVIGHGTITGKEAEWQRRKHFADARLVFFVHVAPNDAERAKSENLVATMEPAQNKDRTQVDLARPADLVVAIGPLLTKKMNESLIAWDVEKSVLRMDPWITGGVLNRRSRELAVLLIGRVRDNHLKGLDLAVDAIASLDAPRPRLYLRGVAKTDNALIQQIWKDVNGAVDLAPQPYSVDEDEIASSYRRARVVLMPSRSEGFGLVGLEAISFGTPILVSSESGLGLCLIEHGGKVGRQAVVEMPRTDSREKIVQRWARKIETILAYPDRADSDARELYEMLRKNLTADRSITDFIAALREAPAPSPARPER